MPTIALATYCSEILNSDVREEIIFLHRRAVRLPSGRSDASSGVMGTDDCGESSNTTCNSAITFGLAQVNDTTGAAAMRRTTVAGKVETSHCGDDGGVNMPLQKQKEKIGVPC